MSSSQSIVVHSGSAPWIQQDHIVHVDILSTYHQKFPPRGLLRMSGQFSLSLLRTGFPHWPQCLQTLQAVKDPKMTRPYQQEEIT
jgi:hypothetical protein